LLQPRDGEKRKRKPSSVSLHDSEPTTAKMPPPCGFGHFLLLLVITISKLFQRKKRTKIASCASIALNI
jgi:ribosomal protein L32E